MLVSLAYHFNAQHKSANLRARYPNVDPFLLKKWETVFNKFFDTNCSSSLEKADFFIVNRHCREIYGAESVQVTYAKKALLSLWQGLEKMADKNKDHKIELEEWVNCLKGTDPAKLPQWFNDYMTFMFKLFDVSADDFLDLAEYTDGMAAYGMDYHASEKCFKKFAVDSRGNYTPLVPPDRFKKLYLEYFYSKDHNALGNFLFGHL